MPLQLTPTLRAALARADRPLVGMWVSTGSPLVAEICARSGLDLLLIDMEHTPNGLETVLAALQVVAAHPVTPLVRVPTGDPVIIKQGLSGSPGSALMHAVVAEWVPAFQARTLTAYRSQMTGLFAYPAAFHDVSPA